MPIRIVEYAHRRREDKRAGEETRISAIFQVLWALLLSWLIIFLLRLYSLCAIEGGGEMAGNVDARQF